MSGPIPESYWAETDRLAAGEYPGALDPAEAAAKVQAMRAVGVTSFVDLTEEHELEPYEPFLDGARRVRLPIPDGDTPTFEQMRQILDQIDAELARGEVVYVHCWGGHGRTGTVIGCWLVRHGMDPAAALERLTELRRGTPDELRASPETAEQRTFVVEWLTRDPEALLVHALRAAVPGLVARAHDHALGETKDLHPEMVAALRALVGEKVYKDRKVLIPHWSQVGNVDLTVSAEVGNDLSLAAEEKWDKLDELVWDLFKMALVAQSTKVAGAFLVGGVSTKKLDDGLCADLLQDARHSTLELCARRYPRGSKRLVWDWLLEGGWDHFPDEVPAEIGTRLIAREVVTPAAAEVRIVRVIPLSGTEMVPFVGGWPNGDRPPDARHPLLA